MLLLDQKLVYLCWGKLYSLFSTLLECMTYTKAGERSRKQCIKDIFTLAHFATCSLKSFVLYIKIFCFGWIVCLVFFFGDKADRYFIGIFIDFFSPHAVNLRNSNCKVSIKLQHVNWLKFYSPFL